MRHTPAVPAPDEVLRLRIALIALGGVGQVAGTGGDGDVAGVVVGPAGAVLVADGAVAFVQVGGLAGDGEGDGAAVAGAGEHGWRWRGGDAMGWDIYVVLNEGRGFVTVAYRV